MNLSIVPPTILVACLSSALLAQRRTEQAWVRTYDGPACCFDAAAEVAVGADGAVYVAGVADQPGAESGSDLVTAKYDPDGRELWTAQYESPYDAVDLVKAMALDPSGNVVVAGSSTHLNADGSASLSEYLTVKYSSDGALLWTARFQSPPPTLDSAYGVAVDGDGNAYVTGWAAGRGGSDYVTLKYSPGGEVIWLARYNGPGDTSDASLGLALDAAGVYVTGVAIAADGTGDWVTVKYDLDGNELWTARYDSPAEPERSREEPVGIEVDLRFNFLGGERPGCLAACDVNGDGRILGEVSDAVFLLNHLFAGGRAPPEPYPRCGQGSMASDRALGCESPPAGCP
jgi:hypothetical protein